MTRIVSASEFPELGKGIILRKNPYKEIGTELYKTTEHYSVYFPKRDLSITFFKRNLTQHPVCSILFYFQETLKKIVSKKQIY